MVDGPKKRYGVVLDAGSSGTRVYIYRWRLNSVEQVEVSSLPTLPQLETKDKWTKKVHPGVSTFGNKPDQVGPDHLQPLLDHALDHIPKDAVPNTPIFLLATAGVRLLPEGQRKDLLGEICSYLKSNTQFAISDCNTHVQVIPGETEGLYGWIAANYLLGGFDTPEDHAHGKGHHTYGFLDMGGASAQIAFAPNATEAEKHSNDLTLLRLRTIDGISQEYKVFVTTWLGFGANEARRRYVKDLEETYVNDGISEVPDPCLPNGLKLNLNGTVMSETQLSASNHYLFGTGKFEECLRRTFPLLEKDIPCPDEPCLVHGVHVPAIDFEVNHFIGISEFWHTTHEIFEMAHKDKSYDFTTYQNRVKEFCEQDWSEIEQGIEAHTWGKKVDEQTAQEVCFKASWLINMLHDGIGIPRVGIEDTSTSSHNGTKKLLETGKEKGFVDPFQAVNKIKSTEVSWTMGKMILYASASIPPSVDGDLPVGFGSNVPGIPKDFQYPGGGLLQDTSLGKIDSKPDTGDSQSITDQIHDTIFKSDAPHRIPGFVFFSLILIIALFYLCGRERRSRIYHSCFPSSSSTFSPSPTPRLRAPFGFLNNLLNRRRRPAPRRRPRDPEGQVGMRLYDPHDFELDNWTSDDETSGLDADTAFSKSSPVRPTSQGRGSPTSKVTAPRLQPGIMDRDGLVVRTESRERLMIDTNVHTKSRSGSPARLA